MRIAQRRFADQNIIGRVLPIAAVDAETGRGIALRIEIDDQHFLADGGERGAEIDCRRGLADTAFLVGDRKHARRLGELHLRRAIGAAKGTTVCSDDGSSDMTGNSFALRVPQRRLGLVSRFD